MNTPYEILIRNGVHAHLILSAGGVAQPVNTQDWPEIASAINAEALGKLATIEVERDAIQTAFDAYKASAEGALTAAAAAIQDPKLSDKATVQVIAGIVAEKAKTVEQREREAIEKQITELQAKLK